MARTRTRATPVPEHNSLIASAIRMPPMTRNATGKTQAWQGEAWQYYDRVAELRFVANWVGNVMSRAMLVAAKRQGNILIVEESGPGADAMAAYHGGLQGQGQMLQAAGLHLTVAGEFYDVFVEDEWHTLAFDKVNGSAGTLTCDLGDGHRTPIKSKQDMVIRVWSPHPKEPLRADAPTQSNRGTLGEIATLSAHVHAQLESRLAGAGILWVPSEVTFPTPKEADPSASQADLFMAVLAEAMVTPIKDRDSASAVVPIVVTAPGEFLEKARHMTFWSELDEQTVAMRDNAVKRLAIGLDTPPEVLLGLSESNHWNAWMVDEASIKSHLEPRLQVVCHAVTEGYLRPALTGTNVDPEDYYVLADTSAIRLRPNRSKEAVELYDRGELSGKALLRETGFTEADIPENGERREWLLRKIATGSTSPEQTQAALRLLGADLGPIVPGETENAPPGDDDRLDVRPRPGATDIRQHDERRSDQRRERGDGLASACNVLVFRALERAGNRLCDARARAEGLGDVPSHERYLHASGAPDSLLDGTWTFATTALNGVTADPSVVVAALDGYVRFLLSNQQVHSREAMSAALEAAGVRP